METSMVKDQPQGPADLARDHLNLAEFPISVLQRQQPVGEDGKKIDLISYRANVKDRNTGQIVPQVVTLETSSRHGLPTPVDETIVLALIYLGKQADNFKSNRVAFTPNQIFTVVGWSPKGQNYERLRGVLRRLKHLTITYENAWWDTEGRQYEEEYALSIIADYRIVRQVSGPQAKQQPKSWVRWDPEFYDSLVTRGSLKHIDFDQLLALKYPIAQRMYRFLDKRFHKRGEYAGDLRDFACGHIGLSEKYDIGELKSKLKASIVELESIGFITTCAPRERYSKQSKGKWTIRFERAAVHSGDDESVAEANTMEQQLAAHGVTEAAAHELVEQHPEEQIALQLEHLEFLSRNKSHQAPENPGAWLPVAIAKRYTPPKAFITKAERETIAAQRQERQRQRKQAELAERLREEEIKRRHDELEQLWQQLSKEEQESILESVLDNNDFLRRMHRKNPNAEKGLVYEQCLNELGKRIDAKSS